MSCRASAVLALLAASVCSAASADDLSPQDFAYAMPITAPRPASAYRVRIPLEVFQHVAHEDLRDIRVFNSRGQVVPYELQQPPPKPLIAQRATPLPLFPLKGDARLALDGLRITVQSKGTAVNVQAAQGSGSSEAPEITSYVADAREVNEPLSALQIHWPDTAAEFSGSLRVEVSDDLATWRSARGDAAILNLRAEGTQLMESRIEFPSTKAKFWRLAWAGKAAPVQLTSVSAETTASPPQADRVTLSVPAVGKDDKQRGYSFDLGAKLPVTHINIELPEPNSAASLEILSRARSKDGWRPVSVAEFYRVQGGSQERRNDAIGIATDFDRYWLARPAQPGAMSGNAAPTLQVSWDATDLVFLAQGSGPFLLAYGSASAEAASVTLSSLLNGVTLARADLGTSRSEGGPARLQAARPVPWKLLSLWSILGLGVALLGWMAFRLSRELARSSSQKS